MRTCFCGCGNEVNGINPHTKKLIQYRPGHNIMPIESIERMRLKKIGKKASFETKLKMSLARKGFKHSDYTKNKISKTKKDRILTYNFNYMIGENNWRWKGGVSKNKEYRNKYQRDRYYAKPNKKLSNQMRAAIKKSGGELPINRIQMVYEDNIKQFGTLTCYLCLQPIEFRKDSLEHKIPLSRGGTNEYKNLAIAHISCNCKKNNKTVEEYTGGLLT